MTTTAQPETAAQQFTYQNPPPGFYFDHDEVKADRGQEPLGIRPILSVSENEEGVRGAITFYGNEGVARIFNGTSLRVVGQGIARRVTKKGMSADPAWSDEKINEEIAKSQLEYRPGKRQGGQSTAQSRAVNAAKKAAGKLPGDAIASMLERVAAMSDDERNALAATLGIDPAQFASIPADEEDEGEELVSSEELEQ